MKKTIIFDWVPVSFALCLCDSGTPCGRSSGLCRDGLRGELLH